MIRAVIVDDEVNSLEALQLQLNHYCPEVEIVAACVSAQEAVTVITKLKPELVFLDVEMPYLNGFELLEKLHPIEFAVIFTTAYGHFAIKAFKYSAVDYLLKPIVHSPVFKCLDRK